MDILNSEFVVALATSIFAIIVAIISGLFSYFSTKRSAKVEAMQAYLQFLQFKMKKLEDLLDSIKKGSIDMSTNQTIVTACNMHDDYNDFLFKSQYLITDNKNKLLKLKEQDDKIIMPNANFYINKNGEATLSPDAFADAICKYCIGVTELITSELKCTYDKFENLSLIK